MRPFFVALALIASAVVVTPAAQAQVNFGLRAGLNVSTFAGDDADGSEAKLGFVGGGYMNYAFSPTLSIQPEVLYSQKGAEATEEGTTISFRVGYIDVPLLLKYTIPTGTNLMPSLFAGPQVGFKLSESVSGGGISVDTDFFKSTDFGVTFGGDIGARLAGRTQQFGVGLRYTLGLTSIADVDGEVLDQQADLKNNVFAVTAYFTF